MVPCWAAGSVLPTTWRSARALQWLHRAGSCTIFRQASAGAEPPRAPSSSFSASNSHCASWPVQEPRKDQMTEDVAATLETLDIMRLLALLPHRYPLLL